MVRLVVLGSMSFFGTLSSTTQFRPFEWCCSCTPNNIFHFGVGTLDKMVQEMVHPSQRRKKYSISGQARTLDDCFLFFSYSKPTNGGTKKLAKSTQVATTCLKHTQLTSAGLSRTPKLLEAYERLRPQT